MRETQKFTQLWMKLLLALPIIVLAVILIMASLESSLIVLSESELIAYVSCFLLMMLLAFVLLKIELRT